MTFISILLSRYGKDTFEYRFGFKDKYKEYLKSLVQVDADQRNQGKLESAAKRVVLDGILYSMEGEDSTRAIDNEIRRGDHFDAKILPIEYKGIVPDEYRQMYDTEEYLLAICNYVGIKIIEEYDRLLYKIELPEDWSVFHSDRYWYDIKDDAGNSIIKYFYDPTFYDRKTYVSQINVTLGKQDGSGNKVFIKTDNSLV